MRRLGLVVLALLLLLPMLGSAQSTNYYPSGGVAELTSSGTALTSTVPLNLPNGSAGSPSVRGGDADSGMYFASSGVYPRLAINGVEVAGMQSGNYWYAAGGIALTNNNDTYLTRESAGVVQLHPDAATSTPYEIKGNDATGSGNAGGNLKIAAGDGTSGTANGGVLELWGGANSGAGQIGRVDVYALRGISNAGQTTGAYELANYATLTEATATKVLTVLIPASTRTGGVLEYCVHANDASDFQSRCSSIKFAAYNIGGTETCVMSPATVNETTDGNAAAISSGTLTYAITCDTSGSSTIQFKVDATSSLSQTFLRAYATIRISGPLMTIQ